MKTGKYNIKDLFVNRYVQQIIIPEIQRDYVWKEKQVVGLLKSIKVDYEKYKNATIPTIEIDDIELKESFETFYKKRNFSSNIGFIYAYNDEQYSGKYFLIDGQQRITTIYLILLSLAVKNEILNEKFKATYQVNGILKLDYKVRESTHNFINEFVNKVLYGVKEIKNQNWYFSNKYDTDMSIQNWISNFEIISKYFDNYTSNDLIDFYSYLEHQVDFWYFDTNISEQGEELYIYMNARGEQMQSNENLKADLLGKLSNNINKNEYGKLWEDWQDFFWVNRKNNENADNGFNDFLSCIAGLERYLLDDKSNFYSKEKFEKEKGIQISDILNTLDIAKLEKYFLCLQYISDNREKLNKEYNYTAWVEHLISELWQILNANNTNWFANYTDKNRASERNKMVLLWSILYYLSEKDLENENPIEIFRFLRKIYLRYNNFNRSVTSIKTHVEIVKINGVIDITDNGSADSEDEVENIVHSEEKLKNQLLIKKLYEADLVEIESLIWQIEDHKFNIDGRDVGNSNISHIVNFNLDINVDYLKKLLHKFTEIFPVNQKEYKKIQQVLLHYGNYWEEESPYYYENLRFDNWRKIIRGKNNYLHLIDTPFQKFFTEFCSFKGNLEEFIAIKNERFKLLKEEITEKYQMFLWYNLQLGNKMWNLGNNLAISKGNPCNLSDFNKKDDNFKSLYAIYNSSGTLRSNAIELSNLIKTN